MSLEEAPTLTSYSPFSIHAKNSLISRFEVLELITPSFCVEELLKYKELICKKSNISNKVFREIFNELKAFVKIVPLTEYSKFLAKAKKICPDPDDVDFFALALKLDCPIWSNESRLKRQSKINFFTKELMKLLSEIKP
ncbi:MAG: PIN domain-containing protein [Thermoproteota archaeon]